MDTVTYSHFRSHLAKVLDRVNDDHVPVLITRQNGKPAIVMSVEDFKSYEETAYLMASPRNAQRLNEAIAEVERGDGLEHELLDP
ncbi:type II toxin-antitoxin system prevent-host-death family antitoxin [Halomonas sp. TRM85114]|uniref:type II toxin-antitoxin system Phd/YefM family antitoxin n=1 Tax=Halomonas jincaotanensis TaxID=2810616 RepID=UPI001BD5502D|nr:type II toxin-antitoxin system prevent-host-death family antitoxin [Halomonas jincaotanensis]MBS9402435.1 type II toxin-antitoxin system prevent-host-death family antitoxin [Halomonas jincaotanensis]HSP58037.1 type II toxin-antitoxin system prevent-host-death family antitoxin [Halomonas sp.]